MKGESTTGHPGSPDSSRNREFILRIAEGDEEAYRQLFFEYYYPLCRFAFKFTKSNDLSRDSVQEVFVKIWNNRENFTIDYSISAYLYRAVRNQALNIMDRELNQERLFNEFESVENIENGVNPADEPHSDPLHELSERVKKIWDLLHEMPEQQKLVFELHRKHGLSYLEISVVLQIAPKTVENHMGRAFKFLRKNLQDDPLLRIR